MSLVTESYAEQKARLPRQGRHITAQYDDQSLVVYQAFVPEVAAYAVQHQQFGGAYYSLNRMSWIKPNFLWMMHRSTWATSPGQTAVLAIWLGRTYFDIILAEAVHSAYQSDVYGDQAAWKRALANSEVRLQWDPVYTPQDGPLECRAIQLGLRGETLQKFAQDGWIVRIEDITPFVHQQATTVRDPECQVPREQLYPVVDPEIARRLQITT
ncbi:MAG TPA: DUF4291 domain-containing protein [Phototrophicaceae bacterium]|jgi:hypothetical protein|nr:DUF4291 domain-containing protein [Phototrophicaceae bacterium]